jgi:hypothetical protein
MLLSTDAISADGSILPRQHIEDTAHGRGYSAIPIIRDDPEQLRRSIAAFGRYDAKFGQVSAQSIAQHRALAHQQLPGPVQHQGALRLPCLDRDEPHQRPRDRFTDRSRIIRIVLAAAFEADLHIARRDQPNRVTQCLKLAAPMMRTGFAKAHQNTPAPLRD